MIKSFISLIKQFKTSSFINILGFSAALLVFFIVIMQLYYDFTFDRGYKNANEIVQFNQNDRNEKTTHFWVNFQIPALIKDRLPEAKAYCLTNWGGNISFDVDKGGSEPENHTVYHTLVTSGFLEVFTPEILLGDTTALFSLPGKVMISEKTSRRIFGDEDPIGKNIKYHYGGEILTIQAVFRDFPKNSSMQNGIYGYLPQYDETEWSFSAYFRIDPKNQEQANEKINSKEILGEERVKYLEENPEIDYCFRLTRLNEMYLQAYGKGGSKRISTSLTLLLIGVLTLIVAFVNFINLSLAMAPSRIRSINVKKIIGINKTTLRLSIAMESVFFALIALIIAFVAIHFLRGTTLAEQMFTSDFSFSSYADLLVIASLFVLLLAFVLGLYTMRYSTSIDESEALKGSFAMTIQGVKLRNVLIVIQFTSAIALICISIFIKKQNDYMLNFDWGMPKKNIVYLPLYSLGSKSQTFGQELLRDPRVLDYSIIRDLPGRVGMNWSRNYEGKQINLHVWSVDERFFDFFDIDILAGRKPEHLDSIVSQIVLNQAFLDKYEFDESIVGKDFPAFGPGRVQAIAKDVNFESLHSPIGPMALGVLSQWQNFNNFLVKLDGNDIRGALGYIEETWREFTNDPFEAHFLDESMDRLYQNENNMAQLITIFGFIIVIIAVMGVYGLILFNTKYKAKEIAIRKVNGSTEKDIILLLNRSVLIQLFVSFLIAVPIVFFVVNRWLEQFAYKIDIQWWVFLLGGLIVFVITLLTVSGQSYRTATSNPMEALNKE